jgi:2-amino-4-hydroxy-6-hydroxymethyldihydropteridine diphosphokinase
MKVYLLLGSNIEPRFIFIQKAISLLENEIGSILATSSLYETAAWGKEDQADFLNQALCVETNLSPVNLLHCIKKIEMQIGRKQRGVWSEREIDIDILLLENIVFSSATLTIPHPRLHERNFAIQPLLEIAPDAHHPVFQKSIAEIALSCNDLKPVKKIL